MSITDKYKRPNDTRLITKWLYLLICVMFNLITPKIVSAQDVVPLMENLGPEYDSPGIQIGGFILKPALIFGATYNDNIYASNDNSKSDFISTIAPGAQLQSIWSRHELKINTGMEAGLYSAESGENYIDGGLSANGKLDVLHRFDLRAHAGIKRMHVKRGDPDFGSEWKSPPVYYYTQGGISSSYRIFRSSAQIGSNIGRQIFSDAELIQGGSADMSINDCNLYNIYTFFYSSIHPVVHPQFACLAEGGHYDRSETRRDYRGYRIGGGADIKLTWLTSLYVFAGYIYRDYYHLEDYSGWWWRVRVQWDPTEDMFVNLYSRSYITGTNNDESSGLYYITSGLSAGHTVLRNILAGASIEHIRSFYKDIDITYHFFRFGFSLRYKWNRYLDARAEYKRYSRLSNFEGGDFSTNMFIINLTGKI